MAKVTTTIRPDDEFEADDAEVTDLRALGILRTINGQGVPKSERNIEQAATAADTKGR